MAKRRVEHRYRFCVQYRLWVLSVRDFEYTRRVQVSKVRLTYFRRVLRVRVRSFSSVPLENIAFLSSLARGVCQCSKPMGCCALVLTGRYLLARESRVRPASTK